ncbi:MAG: phosphate ABC transporter permease subunit PstC [Oscillibacter sp.]|nr:phosphate ABC transporter permease subunit PstC [Oscillibacter sp.]
MRRTGDRAARLFFFLCALTAVVLLLLIAAYLILSGLPAIREIGLKNFLLGRVWDSANGENPQFGILPLLLTSIYGAAGAMALGVPLGVLTALFLARAAPKRVAAAVRWLVRLLAGVPSVVCGLVGMTVLVPFLRERLDLPAGDSLLAAVIVLAVMILPSVVELSEDALAAVPAAYEEASLALGATEAETWFRVSMPAAGSGIAAAAALGIGRAMGEAMAILMVAGNVANMPAPLRSVRFLTTGIAMELGYAAAGSLRQQALFSIALVLFVIILLINILLHLARGRGKGS